MSRQPKALWLAGLVDHGSDSTLIERQIAYELRAQHELIQKLKAAIKTGVDLVHSDVIRVRPSDR